MLIYSTNTLSRIVSILAIALAAAPAARAANTISLLGKSYKLGYYHGGAHSMWEFTTGKETVNNWSTLVTVIDRRDAASLTDLDRLAQGTTNAFKKSGAKILFAQTLHDPAGKPYDYMVAAFDERDKHRYELNFAKIALGAKNAYILIYGVRIYGPGEYHTATTKYGMAHSDEIGKALAAEPAPDIAHYPRKSP